MLGACAAEFHERQWCLGTGGNFSAVASRDPLRLLITRSGADKGRLTRADFLEVDAAGAVVGEGRSSAETLLHLEAVRRGAGAVLHTHSVAGTLVGEHYRASGRLRLTGYEMLKGLEGVTSHEQVVDLPILENSQDMPGLAQTLARVLASGVAAPGFLLAGHGLYAFGRDLATARRHVEILEFLLQLILQRTQLVPHRND